MSEITTERSAVRKILGYAFKWLLPLALTVLLVRYMFQKVDFADMWGIIRHGVDYWWIVFAMMVSVLSHVVRAMRWRLQLRSLGYNPPLMALCCSIFGCYALNLVFPRLGEVWRCTYVSRREKAPLTKVFGSMLADRMADSFSVLTLLILCLIVAFPAIDSFLVKYPVGQGIMTLVKSPLLWISGGVFLLGVVALFRYGGEISVVRKLKEWGLDMWRGFADVGRMKGKWSFVFYSAAIWGCYFIQLYLAFFAFPFTRALCAKPELGFGLVPALVAFVLSSIGMAVPSNGGLGPWNIAVMFGLAIYGISDVDGAAFSMLVWSAQTVMLIILGIYTMVYISLDKKEIKR